MIDRKKYEALAATGSMLAKTVLRALDDAGETAVAPSDESTVEEKTKHLKGKAEEARDRGNHREAAEAHEARGQLHEQDGDHKAALGAYKEACDSLKKHADDCWWMAKK